MKYKVGDRVKIQSLERYNKYKNRYGDINYGCETEILFTSEMSSFCGQVVTITRVRYIGCVRFYHLAEDKGDHLWVAGMFEGLAEEETNDCKKCGLTRMSTRCLFMDNCPHNKQKNIIEIPKDYILKDENGNVINATKIAWEKKKKEYPKTYAECYQITGLLETSDIYGYKNGLLFEFQKLPICRDAYWKVYGEENGLRKPWEPDWTNEHQVKYTIYTMGNDVIRHVGNYIHAILVFPTAEMRDDFYENFKELIEQCKELL